MVPDDELERLSRLYIARFGRDAIGAFSSFGQDLGEMAQVIRRALDRGTKATDEEVAWLNRHMTDDWCEC